VNGLDSTVSKWTPVNMATKARQSITAANFLSKRKAVPVFTRQFFVLTSDDTQFRTRPDLTTWEAVFHFKTGPTLSRKTILRGIKYLQFLRHYVEISVYMAMLEYYL
jgi:hypothetical protein